MTNKNNRSTTTKRTSPRKQVHQSHHITPADEARRQWADNVRAAIPRNGLTTNIVANCAGIPLATLKQLLQGAIDPSFDIIVRVSLAAGFRPWYRVFSKSREQEVKSAAAKPLLDPPPPVRGAATEPALAAQ